MPDFRADGAIAPTKAEHDAIVERLGRPHDSDPPQVRRTQALAPDIAADARVFGVYVEVSEWASPRSNASGFNPPQRARETTP